MPVARIASTSSRHARQLEVVAVAPLPDCSSAEQPGLIADDEDRDVCVLPTGDGDVEARAVIVIDLTALGEGHRGAILRAARQLRAPSFEHARGRETRRNVQVVVEYAISEGATAEQGPGPAFVRANDGDLAEALQREQPVVRQEYDGLLCEPCRYLAMTGGVKVDLGRRFVVEGPIAQPELRLLAQHPHYGPVHESLIDHTGPHPLEQWGKIGAPVGSSTSTPAARAWAAASPRSAAVLCSVRRKATPK